MGKRISRSELLALLDGIARDNVRYNGETEDESPDDIEVSESVVAQHARERWSHR